MGGQVARRSRTQGMCAARRAASGAAAAGGRPGQRALTSGHSRAGRAAARPDLGVQTARHPPSRALCFGRPRPFGPTARSRQNGASDQRTSIVCAFRMGWRHSQVCVTAAVTAAGGATHPCVDARTPTRTRALDARAQHSLRPRPARYICKLAAARQHWAARSRAGAAVRPTGCATAPLSPREAVRERRALGDLHTTSTQAHCRHPSQLYHSYAFNRVTAHIRRIQGFWVWGARGT